MTGLHSGLFGRELPDADWVDFEGLMRLWVAYSEVRRFGRPSQQLARRPCYVSVESVGRRVDSAAGG